MDAAQTVPRESSPTMKGSSLEGRAVLESRSEKLWVEGDGSVGMLESSRERRALFGRQSLSFYKLQAGVIIPAHRVDWSVSARPGAMTLEGRLFDAVTVSQEIELHSESSAALSRRVTMKNEGSSPIRLRLICVDDPTGANSLRAGKCGAIGVNAFGRGSHVAMDEISDPPSARVVGSVPGPTSIYMTLDAGRAAEIVKRGELPGPTEGMTGQILIMQQLDVELRPLESERQSFVSVYDPSKLEDALREFNRLAGPPPPPRPSPSWAQTSDDQLNSALADASALLGGTGPSPDRLDSIECLTALSLLRPESATKLIDLRRAEMKKDGSLPHSSEPSAPGLLETALFLKAASSLALLKGDKKYTRALFPSLRKAARYLAEWSANGLDCGRDVPQGWRRRVGHGFPTGTVPEVAFAAAAALGSFSELSSVAGKPEDSTSSLQASEMILETARRRLIDGEGRLVLNVDTSGAAHREETIDQSVACYRLGTLAEPATYLAHRLAEKDFETGYGPRTVPLSNKTYFSSAYCEGQLGGYWPRAALAHSVVSYRAGSAGIGSLTLTAVARLVAADCQSFGALPGTFPWWLDIERRKAHGPGSDPVVAARLVEALFFGELGLSLQKGDVSVSPPHSSAVGWLLLDAVCAGHESALFVGRSQRAAHLFGSGPRFAFDGLRFTAHELVRLRKRGLCAVLFYGRGQVLCVGSSLKEAVSCEVAFGPRDPDLLRNLSASVQEFDQSTGSWGSPSPLRVLPTMTLPVSIGPRAWTAFRIFTA